MDTKSVWVIVGEPDAPHSTSVVEPHAVDTVRVERQRRGRSLLVVLEGDFSSRGQAEPDENEKSRNIPEIGNVREHRARRRRRDVVRREDFRRWLRTDFDRCPS